MVLVIEYAIEDIQTTAKFVWHDKLCSLNHFPLFNSFSATRVKISDWFNLETWRCTAQHDTLCPHIKQNHSFGTWASFSSSASSPISSKSARSSSARDILILTGWKQGKVQQGPSRWTVCKIRLLDVVLDPVPAPQRLTQELAGGCHSNNNTLSQNVWFSLKIRESVRKEKFVPSTFRTGVMSKWIALSGCVDQLFISRGL